MRTASCKAKGRSFQQKIRDMYRNIGGRRGLVEGDIESRGMGQSGVDIIFSPRAQDTFNHLVECKKHKRVVVPKLFAEHFDKYKASPGLKLLFHENDRSDALVTMKAEDLMKLFERIISYEDLSRTERY